MGVESLLLIRNAPTNVLQIYIFLFLALLAIMFAGRCKCMKKLYSKLIWNGLIRLLMETYFEILLMAALNVTNADWEAKENSQKYSMTLSLTAVIVCLLAPPLMIVLSWRRHEVWNLPNFNAKYGSLLAGIALNNNKISKLTILMIPTAFFLRRVLLVVTILFVNSFVLSMTLMQATSVGYLGFLLRTMPLDSRRANFTEVFNEICTLLLLYTIMLFTHFVPEATMRYSIGNAYIVITVGNMIVHIIIISVISIRACCLKAKDRSRKKT